MMHKQKFKNTLITIALFIALTFSIFTNQALATNTGIFVAVNPGLIKENISVGTIISKTIEIKVQNIQDPIIDYKFISSNSNLALKEESQEFKSITSVQHTTNAGTVKTDIKIDTKSLINKTYFFILEIIVYSKENSSSISSKAAIGVPVILTLFNNQEDKNPKPLFSISPQSRYYFDTKHISLDTQIINSSEKMIIYSGEVIALDTKQNILYRAGIISQKGELLPKDQIKKTITIENLPKKGFLPYYGKARIFIRSTINQERHIETKPIVIWVIPYQLVVLVIVTTITLFALCYLIFRVFLKRKRIKSLAL